MKGKVTCTGYWIAWILVIIGGLNLGLIGIFDWDLLNAVLGSVAWLERLVYILVGLSALLLVFGCRCKKCKTGVKKSMPASSEGGQV